MRDMVEEKKVLLMKVETLKNVVDEGENFEECCRFINKICEH